MHTLHLPDTYVAILALKFVTSILSDNNLAKCLITLTSTL